MNFSHKWKECTNVQCVSKSCKHHLILWDALTIIGFARIAWIHRTLNRVQFVEKALKSRSPNEDTKPNHYFVQSFVKSNKQTFFEQKLYLPSISELPNLAIRKNPIFTLKGCVISQRICSVYKVQK